LNKGNRNKEMMKSIDTSMASLSQKAGHQGCSHEAFLTIMNLFLRVQMASNKLFDLYASEEECLRFQVRAFSPL
jgi:hypothetical protein